MPVSPLKKRASRTVTARVHQLTGQLAAIERMVSGKRSCDEVLHQIEAVRSGLSSVAAIVMNEELCRLSKRRSLNPPDVVRLTKTFISQT